MATSEDFTGLSHPDRWDPPTAPVVHTSERLPRAQRPPETRLRDRFEWTASGGWLGVMLCGLMGLALAAYGVLLAIDQFSWESARGVVVERIDDDRALIRFEVPQGRTIEIGTEWDGPVDHVVTVRYPPGNPWDATTNGLAEALSSCFSMFVIFAVLGTVALVSGVVKWRDARRERRLRRRAV